MKELGDKIPGDKKAEIESAIAAVREALKGSDTDAIKPAYDTLQNKFQAASEERYKHAAEAQQAAGGQPGAGADAGPGASAEGGAKPKKEGDVVDAEFEVVDEDKKK